MGTKGKVALGAVAAASAAAGAYWLYGTKHSAAHRKMAKSWMLKARAETMDALEKLSEIDRVVYLKTVEDVMKRYAGMKGMTPADVQRVANDLKKSWNHISKHVVKKSRAIQKTVKRKIRAAKKA